LEAGRQLAYHPEGMADRAHNVLAERSSLVRRGKRLELLTIGWMIVEGFGSVAAGLFSGSVSLLGFGFDSLIEMLSGMALLWRMRIDDNQADRERRETVALRIAGGCFLALAGYVLCDSVVSLVHRRLPQRSALGIIITASSLVAMPMLWRAKDRVGVQLGSAAMRADAKQAAFCAYLAAITLVGLILNALFSLWWADPVAALMMVPLIAREGLEALQKKA
jgi:divalent metal cation (Fe/Co/Zn/Cd) transporter